MGFEPTSPVKSHRFQGGGFQGRSMTEAGFGRASVPSGAFRFAQVGTNFGTSGAGWAGLSLVLQGC